MFPFWFACNTCRGSFQKLDDFLEHKQQHHFDEFQSTKCIIFEERRISNNEQTISFSPTLQETGEAYPQEYINLPNVKLENENNFDERTNSEFPYHTDKILNFIQTDFSTSIHQDFEDEVDDFITSSKPVILLNSDIKFKPTLEDTSHIAQNSSVTNGSCLNKDLCQNSKTDFYFENKAIAALHSNFSALNRSDFSPTQILIESQHNPIVRIRRLNSQEIQNWYVLNSEKAISVKHTVETADSVHLIENNVHRKKKEIQKPSSRPFKSQDCGISFIHRNISAQHSIKHAAEKIIKKFFKCPKSNCEKTFKFKDHVRFHIRKEHGDSRPQKRDQVNCEKSLGANSYLPKLLPTHSNTGLYKCSISSCPQTFTNKGNIRLHMVHHSGIQYRPFKCPKADCGKAFQLRHHLKEHITTHSDARPFKCPHASCDKTFKNSNGIHHHMKVHSDLSFKKCPEVGCTKLFKWKKALRQHLLTHHDLKLLKCPGHEIDDKTYANIQGTQPAIQIDSGSFKCSSCGKTFQSKYRLKRHISTHSGARTFKCPEPSCFTAFKDKRYLRVHVRRHAKSNLSRMNDFETHNQITEDASSNETTQDQDALSTDILSFKCNKLHCGKQFRNKFSLKRHFVTVHLGKRPFKCPVSTCDYTCKQKIHLKTHLLTKKHTDIQNSL